MLTKPIKLYTELKETCKEECPFLRWADINDNCAVKCLLLNKSLICDRSTVYYVKAEC